MWRLELWMTACWRLAGFIVRDRAGLDGAGRAALWLTLYLSMLGYLAGS